MGEIYYRDRNEGKFDKNGRKKKPNWEYRFELSTVDGKRQRKEKCGFKRKQDAVAAATLAYAEYLGGGEVIEPSKMSFSDVLDSWMEEYCKNELADETIKNYQKRIRNHIKPALGQYAVSSLSTHVIQRFINEMAKAQYSRNTISSVKGIISKALKYAKRIREFVGDDRLILEHHSNIVQTESSQDALDERELLVQSWNAPIILTSLTQLLNTMFGGKTTSIRRFQSLCDSVIVIDEVQTVPVKLLSLFDLAIQFLSEQCRAAIVLCSATQPCLERAEHPLRRTPKDIVPYDEALWAAFRRTKLQQIGSRRLDELPDLIRIQMETTDSLLVVCNKKSEAAYLLAHTRSAEYQSFHLSAAMCMQHRRDVLSKLQNALARGEKILCIATQVIEAGVDISFGAVLRLTAGMDSIVQAAGRCNRNGESETLRPVSVVNCSDEKLGMLRDIQRGKDATLALTDAFEASPEQFGGSLFSDASIQYYYSALYRDMAAGEQDFYIREQKTTLLDLMSMNEKYANERCADAESFFLRQAFKTAGQYFSVFEEDTTDILVPYGDGRQLVTELCSQRCQYDISYRAAVLKELHSYSVSIYQYQKKQLESMQALIPVCGGCSLVLAEGFYDAEVGLTSEQNSLEFWEV